MNKPTTGAIRAAELIKENANWFFQPNWEDWVAETIDRETHYTKMIEFIERVAAWEFYGNVDELHKIDEAQKQAFELLKKVRE